MNRRAVLAGIGALGIPQTTHAQTPVAGDLVSVVEGFLADVMTAGDAEAVRRYVTDDYVPGGRTDYAPGVDAYVARLEDHFADLRRTNASWRYEVIESMTQGENVATIEQLTADNHDGLRISRTYAAWYVIRDGLIATFY